MTNLPLTGNFQITATFKQINNKLWKTLGYHTGIDFIGSDNIYATCDGIVDTIAFSKAYGNYIVIKELNSDRFHYFCHLASTKVKKGDKVNRSTILGIMGSTGNVTGKHLHYEIRKGKTLSDKTLINPADYCGIPNKKGTYNSNDYQLKVDEIKYKVHIQNIGWQEQKENGQLAGTEGEALRLEAIIIYSTVPLQYRVHLQEIGWTDWCPQDCMAGTVGEGKRLEAIEIIAQKEIQATAHIQDIGWQETKIGTQIKIGTEGRALRLEALKLEFVK
jgi:hypothetical protein